ncbi:putative methyltransferase-domain-containing protein [Coniella lustricola]|uniref:25S rRNA adenine-N(1) methyltransferase n=1 Tax=Coniella lustricola TaxID=2025994 RepID=A0A2T3ABB3_9PEZI|nr:putative methyltransferase-domain-containing protein [Coniella lustricola]
MAANKKKKPRLKLSTGRPPVTSKPKSISRQATRALINKIHQLEKRKQQAARNGDGAAEAKISAEISSLGGLEKYQQASLQGQRNDRGGDSSKVLMDWLKAIETEQQKTTTSTRQWSSLRMLEVGALSTTNACSRSGMFTIERIDLNSQGEGILQQDFMERPLPKDDAERFDIISMSLVLNFVPDPEGRGDMLLRTLEFLRCPVGLNSETSEADLSFPFPSLFLVLPAPCVTNSRYLDEEKLGAILASLGYTIVKSRTTHKLVYYLLKRAKVQPPLLGSKASFTKRELRSGPNRNNFAIVLKSSSSKG